MVLGIGKFLPVHLLNGPRVQASVRAGMIRYNTTLDTYEGYDGSEWGPLGGGATGSGTESCVRIK